VNEGKEQLTQNWEKTKMVLHRRNSSKSYPPFPPTTAKSAT